MEIYIQKNKKLILNSLKSKPPLVSVSFPSPPPLPPLFLAHHSSLLYPVLAVPPHTQAGAHPN